MTEQLAIWILGALLAILGALTGTLWKVIMGRITALEKGREQNHEDIHHLETNYNVKFAEVNRNIAGMKADIISEIHKIQLHCVGVHASMMNMPLALTQTKQTGGAGE